MMAHFSLELLVLKIATLCFRHLALIDAEPYRLEEGDQKRDKRFYVAVEWRNWKNVER